MTPEELREYRKEYWKNNRDKLIVYGREYRKKNRERLNLQYRIKYATNPEYYAYEIERHARKRQPKQPVIRPRDGMGRFIKIN